MYTFIISSKLVLVLIYSLFTDEQFVHWSGGTVLSLYTVQYLPSIVL